MYKMKDVRVSKKIAVIRLANAIGVSESEYLYIEDHPYELTLGQAKTISDILGVKVQDIDWYTGIREAWEKRVAQYSE